MRKIKLQGLQEGEAQPSLLKFRYLLKYCSFACCKLSYYVFQKWNNKAAEQRIKDFVKRCLTQADSLTYTTICFPAIGTGNYLYPDTIVAQAMLGAVEEYFSGQPQHLQKVVIALFCKDTKTIHVSACFINITLVPVKS